MNYLKFDKSPGVIGFFILFVITFIPIWFISTVYVFFFNVSFEEEVVTILFLLEIAVIAPILETIILILMTSLLRYIGVNKNEYIVLGVAGFFSITHGLVHWVYAINALYSFSIMTYIFLLNKKIAAILTILMLHILNNSISVSFELWSLLNGYP